MSGLSEERKKQIRAEEEAAFRARIADEEAFRTSVRAELENRSAAPGRKSNTPVAADRVQPQTATADVRTGVRSSNYILFGISLMLAGLFLALLGLRLGFKLPSFGGISESRFVLSKGGSGRTGTALIRLKAKPFRKKGTPPSKNSASARIERPRDSGL